MANAKKTAKTAPAIGIKEIAEATLDSTRGFIYLPESVYGQLEQEGLVEVNHNMKDEAGNPAVRATDKGQSTVTNETQTQAAAAPVAKSNFALEDGVAIPTVKRASIGGETYPFDKMEVGQSFFIAATDERPNPAKSMASTVSSATARYAKPAEDGATRVNRKGKTVPVVVETRKFMVRSVNENGAQGARVWRTA